MSDRIYGTKDVVPAVLDEYWTSAGFTDNGAERIAMRLLEQLSGLTTGQVRQVLRQAEGLLDATATLDCQATSFQQAAEGFRRASGESV